MNNSTSPNGTGGWSRRDFLQSTSVAVGAAVMGGLSIERSAHAAGSDLIKIALVGCGGRGSGAAAQALSTKGNVKLVAVADAFEDRMKQGLAEVTRAA
ncbi:MAG: twin-arginine translocation signal domain-containing protein, partial [Verrucomicrobiales bacterium]